MARFYVFDTEQEAIDASVSIENRSRELYAAEGYEIDEDGHIIGVNVGTGESDPDAQRTEQYAIPQQRLDGKWIIPHPEGMPSAEIERAGTTVQNYVSQDLTDAVVEESRPDWFPPPPELPGAP